MNANNMDEILKTLAGEQVLEVAMMTLPPLLQIDDPQEGVERVMELAGLPAAERDELDTAARQAGAGASEDVVELLRAMLGDAYARGEIAPAVLREALAAAGRKQMVISPDVYYLGVLFIAGYIALVNKGRQSSTEKITIEEMADGSRKVSTETTHTYLNPFTALSGLLDKVVKRIGGD